MTETDKQAPEGHGLTAAEYVLGVLDAGERRAAERRIATDAVFAREVAFWEAKLGGLADTVAPVRARRHIRASMEGLMVRLPGMRLKHHQARLAATSEGYSSPTRRSSAATRSSAIRPLAIPCTSSASPTMSTTRILGFSELNGS